MIIFSFCFFYGGKDSAFSCFNSYKLCFFVSLFIHLQIFKTEIVMAKRRNLKKEISYVAGELFTEALFCRLYIPGVDPAKADTVMARILDMQDQFIARAGQPDAKDNAKMVKAYYKALRADLKKEVDAIGEEISALSK